MKKILILFFFSISFFIVQKTNAQLYGNEWINYNQTYYKCKVYKDSIYRIPISNLTALGMPSTVLGANLQLYRDGYEQAIFVSNAGALTSTDYIEFYGEKANGRLDSRLYQNIANQLNPEINLLSDTAVYFITFNSSTTNMRFNERTNNTINPPVKESYFWNKQKINYRGENVYGKSDDIGNSDPTHTYYNLNSSQYEVEGYVRKFLVTKDSVTFTCANPYTVSGGPFGYFKTTVVGKNFFTNHQMKIYANSNLIADSTYGSFDMKRFSLSIPMSYLNAQNKMVFRYEPVLNNLDRYGVSSVEFRYPSLFNFNNKSFFYFELDPKLNDYYLEISNVNAGGVAPKLYDLSANEFLIGDISTAGIVKFLIPASAQIKKLVLASQATNLTADVFGLESVTFKNYTLANNQGNYIMLTHKNYTDDGTGHDYVSDYKAYRESTAGGSYNVSLAYSDDVYNEFGYGYDFSTLAFKNFLFYAHNNSNWSNKPKQVFLLGKGISYLEYLSYKAAPYSSFPFYPIPTFGIPCSDLLLTDFTKNDKPEISIGRLSAFNGTDIKNYLNKVKEYEYELNRTDNQTSDEKLWQKRILHIAGLSDINDQAQVVNYLNQASSIAAKPFLGASTTLLKKGTTSTVQTVNGRVVDDLINNGVSFVQFFGHGSSSTMDYNLDIPEQFKNAKKYHTFLANGCSVGDVIKLNGQKVLSERFVLTPNLGAICFIANVNTGYSNTLGTYSDSLYKQFSFNNYYKTIGEQLRFGVLQFKNSNFYGDNILKLHCQQILINGDPAIKIYSYEKPDYAVEEKGVVFKQSNLTTTTDSIDIKVNLYNLGKYTTDSVNLLIKRGLPNGIEDIIYNKYFSGIANVDTLSFKIPTYGNIALGQNYLSVELDQDVKIDEISESNNAIKRYFNIYNDDLVPVYPAQFSIISNQGVTLKGSTLNPFAESENYVFEIDTTELFNSPLLKTTNITSKGGVVKWQPIITLKDSTVYYWRTAMDKPNVTKRWSSSSFIYIDNSLPGFNQSHYYQFKKNNYSDIYLDSTNRKFTFIGTNKKLQVQNTCMNGPQPFTYGWADYWVKINSETKYTFGCDPYSGGYQSLQFMVIDTLTGEPWRNTRPDVNIAEGRFGSFAPCRIGSAPNQSDPFFEFSFINASWRKKIIDFLDSIPSGYYVMMQPRLCLSNACGGRNKYYINDWKADTTTLGTNNSLYHKLKNLGFTKIDSFYKNRPMIFWTAKNKLATVVQHIGIDSTEKLYAEFNFTSRLYQGQIATERLGPAKMWSEYKHRLQSLDTGNGDTTYTQIFGQTKTGAETLLATVTNDTSLTFIDANQYPYLKLVQLNNDNIWKTPAQLKYWRVFYQPQPEIALNPNRHFIYSDTLGQGQNTKISVAVENISEVPMDSLLVKYTLIDKENRRTELASTRYKPVPMLDTIHVDLDMNSKSFAGYHTFEIEANPNNDHLEQYHPNNIGTKPLYIVPDNKNPLIDVTFDGVHILDKDIVSSKPFINITLKDENKYLALDDTSLVSVFMKYSNGSSNDELIPYDNKILKFIPATINQSKNNNQARVEFRPTFTQDGDEYTLTVKAKDKSGNYAGSTDYKIRFSVITTPAISSVLNYPNPFTTSTQFVFTITGAEIPSQFKIQILSPTGKVVREITKAELGNLHIGRNITEFKWKGDDQFGQLLGNGVYLYRVVTSLNGSSMEHHKTDADKWIEKGFGKLYIMR